MTYELSVNTKAILLLTAPLIAGRGMPSVKPLAAGEYRRFARRLRKLRHQPADLLGSKARAIADECRSDLDSERLERLLDRGMLLAQAVERWRARAIWVLSRADAGYPRRLKQCLGEDAPPVLYGCGDAALLDAGGLAVVGSRNVHEVLIEYTENVGRLAASAGRGLISGGARGVDRAAMRGALDAGGHAAGVLADGLEKTAMLRENREVLMDGRLVLISPYDPAVRFQVGHAMQRNKLIYALSDAALVVNSDYEKGGTWTGAVEQLDKLKLVPVHVRANGKMGKGLEGLRARGARLWPEPDTPEALEGFLGAPSDEGHGAPGRALSMDLPRGSNVSEKVPGAASPMSREEGGASAPSKPPANVPEGSRPATDEPASPTRTSDPCTVADSTPADELYAKVRELLERLDGLRTEETVAEALQVPKKQAGVWLARFADENIRAIFDGAEVDGTEAEIVEMLQVDRKQVGVCLKRLVEEGALRKLFRPVRYRSSRSTGRPPD